MQVTRNLSLVLFLSLLLLFLSLSGCSRGTDHWAGLVPDYAPFVVVPQQNSTIFDILESHYSPMFDDITPSAIQLTANIDEASAEDAVVEAIILYPDTSNDWQPLWVIQPLDGLMSYLKTNYQQEFAQNRYKFGRHTIERFLISDREIFAVDVGNYILFSESSLGVEHSLRTMAGDRMAMNLNEHHLEPGTFITNTQSLDKWVMQLAQVTYRPNLHNIFDGGEPIAFTMKDNEGFNWDWNLGGSLTLGENPSALLRGIRSAPGDFVLDRYISTNAAAFSILQLEPRSVPPNGEEPTLEMDQHINENPDIWQRIAATLNNEVAFVSFAESGAESTSEFMFLRHLNNTSELHSELSSLAERNGVTRDDNTYLIESKWLGKLIGSELNQMTSFHLYISDDVAVMAHRRGLAEGVSGDADRRRVMHYNDDYMMVRDDLSSELSSLTYVDARRFGTYVKPWLYPQNYFDALTSNLDLLIISTIAADDGLSAEVDITSYQREVTDEPYRECWVFPVSASEITGKPVLADITASSRDEIIFSTSDGSVYVLATDGTEVMQLETNGDTPVGPPVVYDWYGNNQNVILQAAGNSVYAWNMNGTMLPNFPVSLNETITTPLTIQDITRNGIAEIIVGTADRNLHVLNSRGQAVSGWPQSVNAVISDKPLIATIENEISLFVTAENTIHGWGINGQVRDGFPVFLDTPLHGSPGAYEDHLFGAGRDGNLYTIGTSALFDESLASYVSEGSKIVQMLQVSSDGLNSQPSIEENVLLSGENGFYREDLIVVQSSNGSVFLYTLDGELQFTKSLGQPSSGSFAPLLTDINRDQRIEILALADFGRLYAWNILTDQRMYGLPTTGMQHPLIADLYGDGNNEIIAYTREGLRCWTILQAATQ
ncbi:hypothetical protein BH23BAC3_BH23BAC3_03790 [soil metagenome]